MGDGSRGPGRPTAPDHVWDAVRDDYLAGMTGADACRKHGVKLSALRSRSARDGWRRADQPWSPQDADLYPDEGRDLEDRVEGDLGRIDYPDLIMVAHARMVRSVLRGDATGCMRWEQVMIRLGYMAAAARNRRT